MSKQKRNRRLAAKLGVIAGAAVGGTDRAEAEIVRAFPFATSPSATLRPPANTLPAPNTSPPPSTASTPWDIDGDGTVDFNLLNLMLGSREDGLNFRIIGPEIEARLQPLGANNGWVMDTNPEAAFPDQLLRLSSGVIVNQSRAFSGQGANAIQTAYIGPITTSGGATSQAPQFFQNPLWTQNVPGFFGFTFTKDGQPHYGWGEMAIDLENETVLPRSGRGFVITDAYYQTTSNAAITVGVVPEPTSIALLGAGAAGVAAWKARRKLRDGRELAAAEPAAA